MVKTILIVDDDRGLVRAVKKGLEAQGYHVLSAENGEAGLEAAKNKPIDLILLDIMMPGLNGQKVCIKLKADPKTARIPVIFITAKDAPKDVEAALACGAEAHVAKPVDIPELLKAVRLYDIQPE